MQSEDRRVLSVIHFDMKAKYPYSVQYQHFVVQYNGGRPDSFHPLSNDEILVSGFLDLRFDSFG